MKWPDAIDAYIRDQRGYGRINSDNTERAYRKTLELHADAGARSPVEATREHVKKTLALWEYPNSRARAHSCLTSFYDWLTQEGYCESNPSRAVRKAKIKPVSTIRLTRAEVRALIDACETPRERRVILLGLCTGARNGELHQFQGRHFDRDGFVWFSPDITKGKTERWVPVLPELEAVVADIRATVPADHYVIGSYWRNGRERDPTYPTNRVTIGRIVKEVGKRAGITANVYPHLLRHAYGDHIARHAGLRAAQALMGHASVTTTASVYVDRPDLDELSASVQGLRYQNGAETTAERVLAAQTGLEAWAFNGGGAVAPDVIRELVGLVDGARGAGLSPGTIASLASGGRS